MTSPSRADLRFALERFLPAVIASGQRASVSRVRGGHIHDSFRVSAAGRSILLQRLNEHVFPDLDAITHNIAIVSAALGATRDQGHEHSRGQSYVRTRDHAGDQILDPRRTHLTPLMSHTGAWIERDPAGAAWRAFAFIDGAHSVTAARRPVQAESAASAFGTFFRGCSAIDPAQLRVTIPHFHDTPVRIVTLERLITRDVANRAVNATAEIDFARSRRAIGSSLIDALSAGTLPLRVTHNDAKIANVLFDDATGEALSVVDLDTVMPGLAAFDVGDLVRSVASTTAEDAPDISRLKLRPAIIDATLRGWLGAAGATVMPAERASLVTGALVIAYEQGIRFLTDYLESDRYYKTDRPGHNLDRARVQFALLRALEADAERLERVVESV